MPSYFSPPCYRCQDRVLKCHSTCEKYKAYKEKNNEINKQVQAESVLNRMEYDRIVEIFKSKEKRKKWMK